MKFLVLGASGMAGHLISLYLIEQGHNVDTLTKEPFYIGNNLVLDVTNFQRLEQIIQRDYDVIVNAVGILNQEVDKRLDESILINAYLPHFLQKVLFNYKTKIIHLSTDCVFSGLRGQYNENDTKDGLSYYAITKNLGEIQGDKDLTIRTSIIGPDMNFKGIGLFNWFMKQKGTIFGYDHAIWTGVTTLTLAKAIEKASYSDISGIYHLVSEEPIKKYDLLVLFSQLFKDNGLSIEHNTTYRCNKSLIHTRPDQLLEVPCYVQMLVEMRQWIEEHSSLYPHYEKKYE